MDTPSWVMLDVQEAVSANQIEPPINADFFCQHPLVGRLVVVTVSPAADKSQLFIPHYSQCFTNVVLIAGREHCHRLDALINLWLRETSAHRASGTHLSGRRNIKILIRPDGIVD